MAHPWTAESRAKLSRSMKAAAKARRATKAKRSKKANGHAIAVLPPSFEQVVEAAASPAPKSVESLAALIVAVWRHLDQ